MLNAANISRLRRIVELFHKGVLKKWTSAELHYYRPFQAPQAKIVEHAYFIWSSFMDLGIIKWYDLRKNIAYAPQAIFLDFKRSIYFKLTGRSITKRQISIVSMTTSACSAC